MMGSLSSWIVQPAALRSALASLSSNACSHLSVGMPSISSTRPEKMFFLPAFSTVSRPISIALSGIACTRSRSVMPGCISPSNLTSTDSGMSIGFTAVAAANATRPEPAGNETPIGKRVCESPPVPTVSGSSMRLSQLWMMPSPGRSETPPRLRMKSGSVWCVTTSTGRVRGRVAERLHHEVGREAEAREVMSSSRVIGPVVSCEPTVVILGSQYWPGRTPGRPHATPTIFCASVKPALDSSGGVGDANSALGASPRCSRARASRAR